ncbi:MAG TPA: helix-turn-helix domain-containing protein [Mycobacteriales bacterium]
MTEHHECGGTRARIQAVALDLFVEQGYDKTSLREIADRLGVTKAALYYHFRTKDDIVSSFVQDFLDELEEIIDWGRTQPVTDATRQEVIRRYAEVVLRRQTAMRFFQQNPSAERVTIGSRFRDRMTALRGLLVAPDAPLTQRIRALAAVATLHLAPAAIEDDCHTPEELRDALLTVSLELVTDSQPTRPTRPTQPA